MTQRFKDSKGPTEKRVLTFNFAADLETGELLQTPITVAFATALGTDASPSALANGAAAVDATGTKVLVPVQGGLEGCDYAITVTVATSNTNKTLAMTAVLSVRA
jgi:hypothetical protein